MGRRPVAAFLALLVVAASVAVGVLPKPADAVERPPNLDETYFEIPYALDTIAWSIPNPQGPFPDGTPRADVCYTSIFAVFDGEAYGTLPPNGWTNYRQIMYQRPTTAYGGVRTPTASQVSGLHMYRGVDGDGGQVNGFQDMEHTFDGYGIGLFAALGTTSEASCGVSAERLIADWTPKALNTVIWARPGQDPVASFDAEGSEANPLEVTFTNLSSDPETADDGLDYTWDFGDGETSTEYEPVHVYDEAGEYSVTLTVEDPQHNVDTETKPVRVALGVLGGDIFPFPDGDSIVKEGEALDVRLRVENDGDEVLSDVTVESVEVTATDPEETGAAAVTAKPGGETLSGTLGLAADQTNLDFADYHVDPTTAGTVQVAVRVTATTPDDSPVETTITWDLEIRPAPLKVELTAKPAGSTAPRPPGSPFEYVLNENDHDNVFEVEVKVSNQGDEAVEAIHLLDPDDPVDFDTLLVDDEGNPVPGVAIEALDEDPPDLPADDLDPGESMTQTYEFRGTDQAHAEAATIVQGRMGDEAVSGRGTVVVKVLTDVLVEFGMKPARAGDALGGSPVRLTGVLRNVSTEERVGIVVIPTTDGNAGNGNVYPAADAGQTPLSPLDIYLEPEEEVDLGAVLRTMEHPVATDAVVSYEVRVWTYEVDDTTPQGVKKNPAREDQVRILDDEGLSRRVSVRVPPATPTPDARTGCGLSYFSCGVVDGVAAFGQGLMDLVRLTRYTSGGVNGMAMRISLWGIQMLGRMIDVIDQPEVRTYLTNELLKDTVGLVEVGLYTTANLPGEIADAIAGFVGTWADVWRTGDAETGLYELGKLAGENPDLGLEAFLASRIGRYVLAGIGDLDNPIRVAIKAAEDERTATLPARLAEAERVAEAGGTPVARSGVFAHGDALTTRMLVDDLGGDSRDIETLYRIADAEQVTFSIASRYDEVADTIRAGTAYPSPRAIDITPVGDLDIDFLGYPDSRRGFSDLVQPPLDFPFDLYASRENFTITAPAEQIATATRTWVTTHFPDLDPAMTQRVASHLHTRVDEFVVNYNRLVKYEVSNPGLAFEVPVGAQSFIDTNRMPTAGAHVVRDSRPLKLTPYDGDGFGERPGVPYPPGSAENLYYGDLKLQQFPVRRYFQIGFDARGFGAFKPITDGGVEILAVTDLAGQRIIDVEKRARIYANLQHTLGLRNDELPDFVATGRVTPLRQAAEGGEIAATILPGRRATASAFLERRSILADSINGALHRVDSATDFVFMAGASYSLVAKPFGPGGFVRESLFALLGLTDRLPLFLAPSILWRFVDGMSPEWVDNFYDHDGENVRYNDDGSIEVFAPGVPLSEQPGPSEQSARTSSRAPATGSWVPISIADARALGADPDTIEISPMTVIDGALAGDTVLGIAETDDIGLDAGTDWFRPGDRIVVDPGGPNEERATVAALGSLVLTAPLEREHVAGEQVVIDRPMPTLPDDANPPGGPGRPTDPTAPGGAGTPGASSGGDGLLARTGVELSTLLLLALVLLLGGQILKRRSHPRPT